MEIGLIILIIIIVFISSLYIQKEIERENAFKEFKKNLENYGKEKKAGKRKS